MKSSASVQTLLRRTRKHIQQFVQLIRDRHPEQLASDIFEHLHQHDLRTLQHTVGATQIAQILNGFLQTVRELEAFSIRLANFETVLKAQLFQTEEKSEDFKLFCYSILDFAKGYRKEMKTLLQDFIAHRSDPELTAAVEASTELNKTIADFLMCFFKPRHKKNKQISPPLEASSVPLTTLPRFLRQKASEIQELLLQLQTSQTLQSEPNEAWENQESRNKLLSYCGTRLMRSPILLFGEKPKPLDSSILMTLIQTGRNDISIRTFRDLTIDIQFFSMRAVGRTLLDLLMETIKQEDKPLIFLIAYYFPALTEHIRDELTLYQSQLEYFYLALTEEPQSLYVTYNDLTQKHLSEISVDLFEQTQFLVALATTLNPSSDASSWLQESTSSLINNLKLHGDYDFRTGLYSTTNPELIALLRQHFVVLNDAEDTFYVRIERKNFHGMTALRDFFRTPNDNLEYTKAEVLKKSLM